ncbi:MAG: cell division protein SepF [Candidatus Nanoarchaeia archaeon]|nr:cell division protein SepF [Candidatus Haiyanarchaeum thermophilum]MCW1302889.1 cell division protein SepF [Candidatus Haiyanarchaeum thermophilum]MCW1303568.1 cell division protein SepF [Candidatus Haiyanarchaeum thermophilum]MCW1306250.1 cell division protein SepF [Candidatus Haiyanarchaeum thermophilum]MCW1307514.1 cell division protein SepF [Candidatus Haiyanarchaeum thermophilum]
MAGLLEKLRGITEKLSPSKSQTGASEEFVELEPVPKKISAKIFCEKYTLDEFDDVKYVIDSLRTGSVIAIINIKPLGSKSRVELQRAINKIKKTVEALNGQVIAIDEDWVVAAPSFVEIRKGKKGETE